MRNSSALVTSHQAAELESGVRIKSAPPTSHRGWRFTLLAIAYTIPVALLATVVGLLADGRLDRSASISKPSSQSSPSPEPAPPPLNTSTPTISNSTVTYAIDWHAAASPYAGLQLLNNQSAGFFSVWWNQTEASLVLEVPAASLGSPFVVNALASKGDAANVLLHQPLSNGENTVFEFRPSPNGADLDLVSPQFALRSRPNGTVTPAALANGAWPGWVRTLTAVRAVQWIRVDSPPDSDACPVL